MPNIAVVLKAEISRLAKKEVKGQVAPLKQTILQQKKEISELKKELKAQERRIKQLSRPTPQPKASPDSNDRVRITGKGVRSLRAKWGVTQTDFAKILGVSMPTIVNWEKVDGPINMREKAQAAYISHRKLGAREARALLEE